MIKLAIVLVFVGFTLACTGTGSVRYDATCKLAADLEWHPVPTTMQPIPLASPAKPAGELDRPD